MGAGPMFALEIQTSDHAGAKEILKEIKTLGIKVAIEEDIAKDKILAGTLKFQGVDLRFHFCADAGDEYAGNSKPNSLMVGHYTSYSEKLAGLPKIIGAILALQKELGKILKKNPNAYTCAYTI